MTKENNPFEEWRTFYTQCGQLFISFGRLETYLSSVVRRNLSMRMNIVRHPDGKNYAAVLLGSQRFKSLQDTIKRIIEHEGALADQQREACKNVFEQCGHVAALRDKLAHQLVFPDEKNKGLWLISDHFSTRDPKKAKLWQIHIKDLSAASHDLRRAIDFFSESKTGRLFEFIPEKPPAWRYKSSELKLRPTGTRRSPRKRATPPPPSQQ